ncbi:unnamed protein product [Musa hybrid cultivar]
MEFALCFKGGFVRQPHQITASSPTHSDLPAVVEGDVMRSETSQRSMRSCERDEDEETPPQEPSPAPSPRRTGAGPSSQDDEERQDTASCPAPRRSAGPAPARVATANPPSWRVYGVPLPPPAVPRASSHHTNYKS